MNQKVSQQVSVLMQREVTRKEFLGMSGLAIASILGVGSIYKLVSGKSVLARPASNGYGASSYGR